MIGSFFSALAARDRVNIPMYAGGVKQVLYKVYICWIQVKIHISDQTSLRICNSAVPVFLNFEGAQESIPPAYVAGRVGTTNRVVVPAHKARNRFLGSSKGLQIRALAGRYDNTIPTRFVAHWETIIVYK